MIKLNFTYLKIACATSVVIWALGMLLEVAALRWIGFVATILSSIVFFIASLIQYRIAYGDLKVEMKDEKMPQSFKEMNEKAESHSGIETPIDNIIGAVILFAAIIYLNFFRYA